MKTIKVTQGASGKFAPDGVVIRVRLNAESKKYAEAVSALTKKNNDVIVALAALGDKITSRGASVTSVRRDGKTYFCAHDELKISLEADSPLVGNAIDSLEAVGAEWSEEYVLTDNSHRSALVAEAVRAAHDAARNIAAAAGVKVGALVSVEYSAPYMGAGMLRTMSARDSVAASPEPVEVAESVTCEWEIAE